MLYICGMKKMLIVILSMIWTISFAQNPYSIKGGLLYVQPTKDISPKMVWAVDSVVRDFYKCRTIILPPITLTNDLLTPSGKKYDADKIITKFRKQTGNIGAKRILIITEKDISHFGNIDYPEWSIWGLAQTRGVLGVISTYKLKEDKCNNDVLTLRLIKDALHELGHNAGLRHCERDKRCLMNDGSEGLSELDAECLWLCDYCRASLK